MKPMKIDGWSQGLYEQSATKKETLGALRITADGRKFRYAKAGNALAAGTLYQMAAGVALHTEITATATAAGSRTVSVTVGATAVTADQYADGYLLNATNGMLIPVESNTACDASGTTILTLARPLLVALTASHTINLVPNPWNGVTSFTNAVKDAAGNLAGAAAIATTNAYYAWLQTGGVCSVLCGSQLSAGLPLALCSGQSGGLMNPNDSGYSHAVWGYAFSGYTSNQFGVVILLID